ncbi:hypothetical protein Tco_0611842 [Tanacetum coccineum]
MYQSRPTFRGSNTRSGGLDPKKKGANKAVKNELGMASPMEWWLGPGLPTMTNIFVTNDDIGSLNHGLLLRSHISQINHRDEDKDAAHSDDPFGLYDLLKNKQGQNVVKSGGSVLDVMEDIIRVGQVMGYSMEGCVKDLENIIGKQGEDNVIR